jgi:hypothetical protein
VIAAVVVMAVEAEEEEITLERGNLGDDACVCVFRMHLCVMMRVFVSFVCICVLSCDR